MKHVVSYGTYGKIWNIRKDSMIRIQWVQFLKENDRVLEMGGGDRCTDAQW